VTADYSSRNRIEIPSKEPALQLPSSPSVSLNPRFRYRYRDSAAVQVKPPGLRNRDLAYSKFSSRLPRRFKWFNRVPRPVAFFRSASKKWSRMQMNINGEVSRVLPRVLPAKRDKSTSDRRRAQATKRHGLLLCRCHFFPLRFAPKLRYGDADIRRAASI